MSSLPDPGRAGRRRLLLAAGAVVLVLAVVLAVVLGTRGDDAPAASPGRAAASSATASAPGTSSSPTSAAPSAVATTGAPATDAGGNGDQLPPSLAPVALDQPATGETGVSAALTSVEGVQATGNGPGNVSGPALRVGVRITNGTAAPLPLAGVQVTLTYSAEQTPASPVNDPSAIALSGTLDPGASADGAFVFTVPADQRSLVTVTVGYQAGAPFLVFSGPAA